MAERRYDTGGSVWWAFQPIQPTRAHARANQTSTPARRPWGDDVRSVLCIRMDNLGDVLMTSPAISLLRHAVGDRRVTLLAAPSGQAAASLLPDIDEVIVHRPSWMPGAPAGPDAADCATSERALIDRLRFRHFDAAVIFTAYSQNPLAAAMLCHLAGIPRVLAHCRENPYGLVSDWVAEREPVEVTRHEVQRQVDLVRTVIPSAATSFAEEGELAPSMDAVVKGGDVASLNAILRRHGIDEDVPFLVVHVGATAGSRCYPPDHFAAAISKLRMQLGWPIVLTGSAAEKAVIMQVIDKVPPAQRHDLVDLSASLSLQALAALLGRAAVLLSNNSGPVHLAAALRTPVVVLYALTNPQHTPWRTPCRVLFHDVSCRWCYRSICPEGHHACLREVDARTVADAVLDLLMEVRGADFVASLSIATASTG